VHTASGTASPLRTDALRPILKWAGGKRQLLPALRRFYPERFDGYIEPFLGSAAVFVDLYNRLQLAGRRVHLSDLNADIIGCYLRVRDSVEEVITALHALERGHAEGGRDHFFHVRDARFNRARHVVHTHGEGASAYSPDLAAMLIYLNRTGYNGLFRVNSRGAFNVPPGRYASPTICDAENLRRLSRALGQPDVTLEVRRFETALETAGAGDFVYLDPPYAPLSRTASFTSYTSTRFGRDAQALLQQHVVKAAGRGASILLSNSVTPDIQRLYDEPDARAAGLRIHTIGARRAINSRASGRGGAQEYLITNVG
jgi:DNA adenine methylase